MPKTLRQTSFAFPRPSRWQVEQMPKRTSEDKRAASMAPQPRVGSTLAAWPFPVPVAEIPSAGRCFDLRADQETRRAVAEAASVPVILQLSATFQVVPALGGGVRVLGAVKATIEQNCVVTLEPLQSRIEEQVDVVFAPPAAAAPVVRITNVEVSESDAAELLDGGMVDLGALAVEFLILGVDPYPRRPGASFEAPEVKNDAGEHPFAALSALKHGSGKETP